MVANSIHTEPAPFVRRLLAILDPLAILIAAPGAVWAPSMTGTLAGIWIGLLLLPFLLRFIAIRRFSFPSPANKPLCVIVWITIPVSIWASPMLRQVSWPMLACLLWSIALFFAIVHWTNYPWAKGGSRLSKLTWVYLLFGLAMMTMALLGAKYLNSDEQLNEGMLARLNAASTACFPKGFFQNNEIAGMIIVFAPLCIALMMVPPSALQARDTGRFLEFFAGPGNGRLKIFLTYHLPLAAFAILFFIGIFLTRSRGGVLSLIAAVFLVFLLMGKRGIPWLGIGGVLLLLVFLFLGQYGFSAAVLNTGLDQQLSLNSLLTGRPSIWNSALHGIHDFKLTGMGIGTFGDAMFHLYPSSFEEFLEDAHNFFLQTALDLGIVGLVAMLWLLGSVLYFQFAIYRRSREDLLRRHWAIGIIGSLAAYLLYSLTDSVSLGTPGNSTLWFLLGLAVASIALDKTRRAQHPEPETGMDKELGFWKELRMLYGGRETRRKLKTRNHFIRFLFPRPRRYAFAGIALAAALLVLIACLVSLPGLVRYNLAARDALRAYFSEPSLRADAENKLSAAAARYCGAYWLLGKLAEADEDEPRRNEAWTRLIECTPDFNRLIHRSAPANGDLAAAAVEKQPASPDGYFWLAELEADENRDEAISLLRKGLDLDPENGLRWCYLGNLLARDRDLEAAIEAYLNCCYFGDPGSNGCWRAGIYAERLGRPRDAIRYYRKSRWKGAHQRANELEQQLLQNP